MSNATDIVGATSATYTPVTADVGKRVKVKVSFTDDASNSETLTSEAYPSSGTIAAPEPSIVPVCNRTAEIRDAIVQAVSGVSNCANITAQHLAGITSLSLTATRQNIGSLQNGDFSGLTSMTTLAIGHNSSLSSLPADVFDGLSSLTRLRLANNSLTCLPGALLGQSSLDLDVTLPACSPSMGPTVTSIARRSPTTLSTNADSLTWRVTFSEDVQNVDAADFEVDGTGATLTVPPVTDSSTATVTAVQDTIDDDAETVIITASSSGNPIGEVTVTITDDAAPVTPRCDAPDLAGRERVWQGTLTAVANGIRLNGATIRDEGGADALLDYGAAPGVTAVQIGDEPSGDGRWSAGEVIEVVMTFAEPVVVGTEGGTPTVTLTVPGVASWQAPYTSGSATDALTFAYTLSESDSPVSSVLLDPNSLALEGGSIVSTGGTLETDTDFVMGAFGGRGLLLAAPDTGGFQLATRTDAILTRTTSDAITGATGNLVSSEADAHRLRLVLEGSRPISWEAGQSLTAAVEIGPWKRLRHAHPAPHLGRCRKLPVSRPWDRPRAEHLTAILRRPGSGSGPLPTRWGVSLPGPAAALVHRLWTHRLLPRAFQVQRQARPAPGQFQPRAHPVGAPRRPWRPNSPPRPNSCA